MSARPGPVIDGLAIVDKPPGMTSHDVVARCRRIFGQRRVGHAGTLDPDATGVLVVGLGQATRLMQFQGGLLKSYTGEIVLGVATSTLDASGQVTGRWDQRHVTLAAAGEAAAQFTGSIWQIPPMVSAVKVGGRPLHQLARQGIEVERAARPVQVTCFHLDACTPLDEMDATRPDPSDGATAGPVLSARVQCSAGTYVRVLAADLGAALGGGAYLRRLRRTAVGPWTDGMARPLDDLGPADVIAPRRCLPWLEATTVDGERATQVRHGRVLSRLELDVDGDGPWRVIDPVGDLLAVYQLHGDGRVKPVVVLAPGAEGETGSASADLR